MTSGNPETKQIVFERYEIKYVVPEEMIEPLSRFCSIYCTPDQYSEKNPEGFYTVNSLYFDTPNYLFLHKRLDGSENRFNMRVRTYDDQPLPCFLEIKQKRVDIIRKYRAIVHDREWYRMFDTPGYRIDTGEETRNESNKHLFYRLAYTHNIEPVVLTTYRRRAFESAVDEYARVTFDKDLKFQPAEGFNLVPDAEKAIPYDNSAIFDPECNVIVEMKCHSSHVPYWMIDMIQGFGLQRRAFSKYVMSVVEALNLYRYDAGHRQTNHPSLAGAY